MKGISLAKDTTNACFYLITVSGECSSEKQLISGHLEATSYVKNLEECLNLCQVLGNCKSVSYVPTSGRATYWGWNFLCRFWRDSRQGLLSDIANVSDGDREIIPFGPAEAGSASMHCRLIGTLHGTLHGRTDVR